MSLHWQISWGELFEVLRPLIFVIAALVSTWVLADARRRGFTHYAVAAWTLLTLFFTFIILPLYLIARTIKWRGRASGRPRTEVVAEASDRAGRTVEGGSSGKGAALPWRRILPLLYASAVFALGTLYFYRDYRSVDAHLARAKQAKLLEQRERVIGEYRAALRLENDPHTHKLLGAELAAAERWEEALAEFRAAEDGGEQDDLLPYDIAVALDSLSRMSDAAPYYRRFLNGSLCAAQISPAARCERARVRLQGDPKTSSEEG